MARIIYSRKDIAQLIGIYYSGERGANLCNIESCKVLFEDIPFNEEVEEISTAHKFKYLNQIGKEARNEIEMKSVCRSADLLREVVVERSRHTRYRWSRSWKL